MASDGSYIPAEISRNSWIDTEVEVEQSMLNTAIETSAFGRWEDLSRLIPLCDTVFIDCKCMDSTLHKKLTGVDNGLILSNLQKAAELCCSLKLPLIVRLPLIPTLNDSDENLTSTGHFVASLPGSPQS